MEHTAQELIRDRFRLELDLLRLEREIQKNKVALAQAKFNLREAKANQIEYGGSFKSLRDRLTGHREETETALHHAVQKAEADLAAARRSAEQLEPQPARLRARLDKLPAWESLNDGSREWYRLEALYCMEAAQPLLEINLQMLEERRRQFNGGNAGQLISRQTWMEIYSAPEEAGEACASYILRLRSALEKLEIPFVRTKYFDGPTAFLSAATKFTRMDRLNDAIDQVQVILNRLPKLQKQIGESY